MSDENRKKGLSPFMERFLISILGTTLSIALTFGTTALVNSHKKKTAQRLTDYYGKNLQEDLDAHPRMAHKGSFNLTRSKMELTFTIAAENGEPYEQTSHFKRK